MKPLPLLALLTVAQLVAFAAPKPAKPFPVTQLSPIAAGMTWIGKAVEDPEYYVWCTSPIVGEDRKIHLFCSRWPKKHHMGGWFTHSEIVHYVGDKPEGPFAFADLSIPSNPGAGWNNSMHNPAIFKVGKKYVLLYITFDRRKSSPVNDGAPGGDRMLTGMAVSDSLNGPWKKLGDDGLMFRPSKDPTHWTYKTWAMDNPTFLEANGKYYIYFKGGPKQMKSRYGYAVADKLEGPYTLSDAPCTDNIDYIEDATAFVWKDKFCLLTNDNNGSHTGINGGGILWQSRTPTDFKLAEAQIGFLKTSDYAKGVDKSKARPLYGNAFKFERPGILMLDGEPAYFYGPSGVNLEGADRTCSYVMRIDTKHPNPEFLPAASNGKPATASSAWSDEHAPAAAFDNNSGTRWAAARGDKLAWLAVDLGAPVAIARIALGEPAEYARVSKFLIQVKRGDSWETVAAGETIRGDKEIRLTTPVTGREFRLLVTESTGEPTLAEFKLYR